MSKLALPPLAALPPQAQSAFRAIAAWANTVDDQLVRSTKGRAGTDTVGNSSTRLRPNTANADRGAVEAVVTDVLLRRSIDIFRTVLSNSGSQPLVEMNAPVLFRATNGSGPVQYKLFIGAGGIAGGYLPAGQPDDQTTLTFSLATEDGAFFFGAEDVANTSDPAHRQIIFDATNNSLIFGSSIVLRRSNGQLITMEGLATGSSAGQLALQELANKLTIGETYILGADVDFKTSGYDGGSGLAITNNGILAKSGGATTFAIAANGNATFSGDISGASGTFTGAVSTASYVNATGSISVSGVGVATVVGRPTNGGFTGVCGVTDGAGVGVLGVATSTGGTGVLAQAGASGTALSIQGKLTWGGYSWPQPNGSSTTYLRADGTWGTPGGGSSGVSSFNSRTGAVTLSSSDVTGALGFSPLSSFSTAYDSSRLGGAFAGAYCLATGSPSYVGQAWGLHWYRIQSYFGGQYLNVLVSY